MSYCRFSCMDGACDVYCYESVHGGFVTHVATNRIVFVEPLPPSVPFETGRMDEFLSRSRQVASIIDRSARVPIGLPHDGEEFVTETASETADLLERLLSLGYQLPQYAIDNLRAEDT